MPDISVNLPTRNRAAFLEPCLMSLCEQRLAPARYEICVVNNGSTDDTPGVINKVAARYPHHRLFMIDEPKPGLSRARNTGMRHTSGPLIAHIDDDGTVYPDWLERFLTHFAEKDETLAVVGGEIEPVWGAPRPDWLTPHMQCFLSAGMSMGNQPRFLECGECASEGNSCYRRSALKAVGGFPEELGRVGDCLLSGEGVVESLLREQGGRTFFDPAILLRHHIHADRLTPMWLRRRFFWQGASTSAVRAYEARHGKRVPDKLAVRLPLDAADWHFLQDDTPENLEKSVIDFFGLGFILAQTGILSVET